MTDKPDKRPSRYSRAVWGRTYADWKATRDRLVWGVITAVLGVVIGAFVRRQMTPLQRPLEAGAIGAVGGVVLAALLYLLWHRFRAPARIWVDDQLMIAELTTARKQLEAEVARLKTEALEDRRKPAIDDRLEYLQEVSGFDREEGGSLHTDTIQLRARAEIDPPLLDVECTAPIYSVSCVYHPPKHTLLMRVEQPVQREPDRVLMQLGLEALPAGTDIVLTMLSPVPLRLRRIAIGSL